ncbi:MAG: glycosyltransferase [Caloramator sp.]|nr:glycosyltransferase [Caloramator sp.]
MLLSIALMIKNEEKYIEQCLQALLPLKKEIPAEIIVVDTGSTDNSVNIAKRYADRVYKEKWKDDFAYMRNLLIDKCKGSWILMVDGDEILESPKEIITFFKNNLYKKYNSAAVFIKNMNSDDESRYIIGTLVRLFKNDKKTYYTGIVHEQLQFKSPVYRLNTTFKHYGYNSKDYQLMIYKYERNIELLKKQLNENPDDIYTLFQITQSYSMMKKDIEALNTIKRAYWLCKKEENSLNRYLYVYHQYVKELLKISDFQEIIRVCEEVIKEKKGYIDFYYLLGISYDYLGFRDKALKYYQEYLNVRDNYEQSEEYRTLSITNFSYARRDEVISNIIKIQFNEKKYKDVLRLFNEIVDEKNKQPLLSAYITSCVIEKESKQLKNFLANREIDDQLIEIIISSVKQIMSLTDIKFKEIDFLLNINKKIKDVINIIFDLDKYKEQCIEDIDYAKYYNWKAIVLGERVKLDKNNIESIISLSKRNKIQYINYLVNDYEVVNNLVLYLKENILTSDIQKISLICEIEKALLINKILPEEEYIKVYHMYLSHKLIKFNYIYKVNLENNSYKYIDDEDDLIAYRLIKSMRVYEKDKIAYINILKNIVKTYEEYKILIDYLRKNIDDTMVNDEIREYKHNVMLTVEQLVANGDLLNANKICKELYSILKYDVDILNANAVVEYNLNNIDKSLEFLVYAYILDDKNFETLYNIANVLEYQSRLKDSLHFYKLANEYCKNEDIKSIIKEKINMFI